MIITLLTAIAVILLAITITLWGIRDELRLIGKTVDRMYNSSCPVCGEVKDYYPTKEGLPDDHPQANHSNNEVAQTYSQSFDAGSPNTIDLKKVDQLKPCFIIQTKTDNEIKTVYANESIISPIAKSEKPKVNLNPEEAVIWREKFAMLLQDKRERMNDTKALFKKYRTTKQTWDKWASDDQKTELITLQNECRRRAGERVFSRGYYPKKGK